MEVRLACGLNSSLVGCQPGMMPETMTKIENNQTLAVSKGQLDLTHVDYRLTATTMVGMRLDRH